MNRIEIVSKERQLFERNFDSAEYDRRIATTQEHMRSRGFDLLVIGEPANMNYLIGYNAYSFYSPQVLALPASGEPIFYVRHVDGPGAVLTTRLTEAQVRAYPETYVQKRDCHPMDWIAADMRERGFGVGRIAVEMDANYYTVRGHNALVAGLPEAAIVDAEDLVNWVRTVKSPAEIEKMRTAGDIVTRMITTALDIIEPGVRQCDAVAEIYRVGIRGLETAGGDYPSIVPLLPTGAGAGIPHMTWSDDVFKKGEATAIEIAGCYQRYHSPLARTVFLGEPSRQLSEMADIVGEGMVAALAAVRVGVTGEEVDAAWRDIIEPRGIHKSGRIAYPIGLGYPPDWGERTVSFRPGDSIKLESGMTFHMILGMWMDGWGYEISESFVVTYSGAECFASVPRGLTIKA
jgi:ectoine hydrolase